MPKKYIYSIILTVFVITLGSLIFLGFEGFREDSTQQETQPPSDSGSGIRVQDPSVNVVVEDSATKSFDELKEDHPDVVRNPNLSDAGLKQSIDSDLNRSERENYKLTFDGSLEEADLTIIQGDYVTWTNDSELSILISGENDWGSFLAIEPGRGFTQEFTFLGTYNYNIVDEANNSILASGTVEVVSPN